MTAWIARRDGEVPPGGLRLGVKDNIDVAGFATTAGCPAFAYEPTVSAPVVIRLEAAGAVVIGKTALDQFATGLVGTRSPHGALESPLAPGFVSGGSSSGSAVAVATGEADIALGTDTAGSGRVPAAFCGIVGLKPTPGWLSTVGVVPACRSFDCVSMFARDVVTAAAALEAAAEPVTVAPSAPVRRIGVPSEQVLASCDDEVLAAWEPLDLAGLGYEVVEVDLSAYLAAGQLLYDGALVAERHAAVGAFVDAHLNDVDPVVGSIIRAAGRIPASEYVRDVERLAGLAADAARVWDDVDGVVLPTAPHHPTLAEVAADPIGANAALGRFTNGCNLVGWCAAAVPAGTTLAGLPFGVSVLGPAWSDRSVWAVGAAIAGQPAPPSVGADDRILVAVCGAHLEGQPLNHQLTSRQARLVARTATAPTYRLVALPTDPPKPGLVRTTSGGAAVEVEVWSLDAAGFGSFVAEVPAPLAIGTVVLADGTAVKGFTCEGVAADGAPDITAHGGWRAWLASR
ncbi:MAG TPA: allophanate hydrolase [Iamia sp.]